MDGKSKAPTLDFLKEISSTYKIHLVAGIGEIAPNNKLYNTAVVYNDSGEQIAKYRKLHLLEINVPGGMQLNETKTFSPGDQITVFDSKFGKMGLGICNDLRFPE